MNSIDTMRKTAFSLESNKVYNQTTEVTPLPPSLPHLIVGKEIVFLAHSLQLGNGNENVRSGR
jgi:hypothetical protein